MPIELSTDTPPALVPLSWLIGSWAGVGVVGYPTMDDVRFGQELEFRHDGRPFLAYRSRTWLLDADGVPGRPLATETGFWRPVAADDAAAPDAADDAGSPITLEVLLAHPTGFVEIYLGSAQGPRITLSTDVVARTRTAKEYTSATRLYGLVDGDLLWAMDMSAVGQPLQSHASARLKRVPPS
jgi:THAP4-like, heme-binding beta-barrel domain